MAEKMADYVHNVVLPNDHGKEVPVSGKLLAEDMHFNNTSGMLTVEKVYANGESGVAYGVISAIGHSRDRRAYLIEELGDQIRVSNGSVQVDVAMDDLLALLAMTLREEESSQANESMCDHMRKRLAANS